MAQFNKIVIYTQRDGNGQIQESSLIFLKCLSWNPVLYYTTLIQFIQSRCLWLRYILISSYFGKYAESDYCKSSMLVETTGQDIRPGCIASYSRKQ